MGLRNSRTSFPDKTRRQEVAARNMQARSGRSDREQLERLDRQGFRAVKERIRLQKRIA